VIVDYILVSGVSGAFANTLANFILCEHNGLLSVYTVLSVNSFSIQNLSALPQSHIVILACSKTSKNHSNITSFKQL